jgi:hypothetical protein
MSLYNTMIAINTGTKTLATPRLRGNRPTNSMICRGTRLTRLGTLIVKRILRWSFVGVHVHVGVDALFNISWDEAVAIGEASS